MLAISSIPYKKKKTILDIRVLFEIKKRKEFYVFLFIKNSIIKFEIKLKKKLRIYTESRW